ncbi:MAG TPA: MFS transporter [Steroidobacteraceae bacterium]|nr:MFS transporter [Steroidobacteraceae bacterium]
MNIHTQAAPLTPRRYIGYGLGDFAFNFYWLPLQYFILKYYTDVLGLPGSTAGLIILTGLVWDGLIDPAIGVIANKTRSRWGRYRPYMLFGCVPLAASFTLLFLPVPFKDTSLIVYAFATQLLFRSLYAAVNIPYGAMMASMTRDSMERNWLAGVRMFFAYTGGSIVGYATPRLVEQFAGSQGAYSYFVSTALLSSCAIVVTLVSFAMTEERIEDAAVKNGEAEFPSLPAMLKMIAANRPFLQVMAAIALFSFANVAVTTTLPYFIQYYMGLDQATISNASGMIPFAQMLSILPWTIASKYLGKRWAWIAGLVIAVGGLSTLYAIDKPSTTTVYVLLSVFSVGAGAIAVNFWSMVPDTVEYGEWRSGVRAEGFIFGFVTLIQKVALGLASAFVGGYLSYVGYVANQTQSAETLHGIKLLVTVIACAALVASCVVIYFYRLNVATHSQIVREIAERPAAKPA